MYRRRIGLAALAFLGAAAGLYLFAPAGSAGAQMYPGSLRIAAVLGAVWLALPDLDRWSNQLFLAGILGLAVVVALWPKLFFIAAGVLILVALLRPRLGIQRR